MNILFTGASSFTGMWFAKELVDAGHSVTAIFKSPLESYSSLRLQRIQKLQPICKCIFDVKFGDEKFIDLIKSQERWDLLCHHAADVTNYKSPDFDVVKAVANNTHNIAKVMESLREKNCSKIILTGSVFEQREGAGTLPLKAVSPYGLSKGLTYDMFAYYATTFGMSLGKFVIPNPFGPYEEARFTSYLIETWMENNIAQVKTPAYVRDNIPVSLLAKAYATFASRVASSQESLKYNPSCYVESQGAFACRLADAMKSRLNLPCELQICEQVTFNEPLERVNINRVAWTAQEEAAAWDALSAFYVEKKAQKMSFV